MRTCRDKRTDITYAVKILRKDALYGGGKMVTLHENNFKKFIREIDILKVISHPNIVKLHEVYEDEKRVFLVIEYCYGRELQE